MPEGSSLPPRVVGMLATRLAHRSPTRLWWALTWDWVECQCLQLWGKNWRTRADTGEETYNPTPVPCSSENLSRNLHFPIQKCPFPSAGTILKTFHSSDSWDQGLWPPFQHGDKAPWEALVPLTWCHCCRILSLLQRLSSQESPDRLSKQQPSWGPWCLAVSQHLLYRLALLLALLAPEAGTVCPCHCLWNLKLGKWEVRA